MNIEAINKLLSTGENGHIEFKTSRFELNRDVFESVCAFMNREGGELLLGVNLIESYERLLAFIQKHLPDKFYLEKDQRVSLRDRMFREVISNLLIHREFSNAFPAKLIIERSRCHRRCRCKCRCK